ncbi:hypothetical protein NM688_g374 [Phlebia brevispora]|uniref:Uncharacterized protein n=1 Tax=Phlebia brevispora TaxID=194682 RepID=A0ACC1TEI2_9APHY|nr:hypothetical protein NM688_g374 [Phlebia brevispora]
MPRELRQRTSRPNYAALLRYEDEDEAGPSNSAPTFDDEGDSGSDFTPEVEEHDGEAPDDDLEDEDEEDELPEDDIAEGIHGRADGGSPLPRSRAAKTPRKAGRKSVALASGVSMVRQGSNALPSLHHRHRSIPIHQRKGQVERLAKIPRLFSEPETLYTNGWSADETVHGRVGRAWGYNVGPGPLWELLEDRGWFKEAEDVEQASEATRRPKVYQSLRPTGNCEVLPREDAAPYLPTMASPGAEQASTLNCRFGPVEDYKVVETRLFDSLKMDSFFPGSKSHVFNAGAPVWGLDWCPIHPDDRKAGFYRQYLAVGPLPSWSYSPEIGVKKKRPCPACIQIWSLGPSSSGTVPDTAGDPGTMKCELVVCIDSGPAHELKWCPLPSHDSLEGPATSSRRLGLLAGTFEDGSLSIYVVPYPSDLVPGDENTALQPTYIKASPLLRIELEDTAFWCLDWANSEVLAAGCCNGAIAVYNVKNALEAAEAGSTEPILPDEYFFTHQCAIRSIAWVRAPTFSAHAELSHDDPTVIIGGGYDGLLSVTDIREPYGNEIYRTRDVINSVCYSPYYGGSISLDQGQVKAESLAPVMLNKGHALLDPDGPTWSLHASDYHPQLAVGVTDGSCITTNTLRTTRRGGAVPFLMHKIYQLDYNRKTGQFRMLDHILPKEIDRTTGANAVKQEGKSSGAWPPEIGVQRVVWNNGNGLANASRLASATGCGLCRVDWLTGKWLKERMPYYGIEGIRNEVDADDYMEDDSD